MELLVSANFVRFPFPLRLPSPSPTEKALFLVSHLPRKRVRFPILCSTSAAASRFPSNYGGWDDLALIDSSAASSKHDALSSFLVSVGIHDRKHALLFLLGSVSALALSRIRFPTLLVLPLLAAVFVIGFSSGVALAGRSLYNTRVSDENLNNLGALFGELDAKMVELGNGLEDFIGSDRSVDHNIKNFVAMVESLRSAAGSVKKAVENSFSDVLMNGYSEFGLEGGKKSNEKPVRKIREFSEISHELAQFLGSVIHENLVPLKPSKAKDTPKKDLSEKINDANPKNEETDLSSSPNKNVESSRVEQSEKFLGVKEKEGNVVDRVKSVKTLVGDDVNVRSALAPKNGGKPHDSSGSYDSDMFSYDRGLDDVNRSFFLMSKQGSSRRMVFKEKYEANKGIDARGSENAMDFFTTKSEASSVIEETVEISDRSYSPSREGKSSKFKVDQGFGVGYKGETVYSDGRLFSGNLEQIDDREDGYGPSSSAVLANEEFNQNVKEASDLLKRARERLTSQADEEKVDAMLYKSASLLSLAVSMKPMSIVAVGQLGNTYLLHGELKLKISRELRTLLLRSDGLLNGKGHVSRFKKLDTDGLSKEKVASVLVDVCEECEALLAKAGRTYRMALSIDRNDMRTLYNWGIALSFRAQLIADIGPEAAFDADKLYLAAIDKFDAMMSRSNAYAPNALYRWGLALQQRSRLHPHNSKEKMKLLQQAKSLFEEVLSMESNDKQIREALSSCISELDYREHR